MGVLGRGLDTVRVGRDHRGVNVVVRRTGRALGVVDVRFVERDEDHHPAGLVLRGRHNRWDLAGKPGVASARAGVVVIIGAIRRDEHELRIERRGRERCRRQRLLVVAATQVGVVLGRIVIAVRVAGLDVVDGVAGAELVEDVVLRLRTAEAEPSPPRQLFQEMPLVAAM